MFNGEAEEAMKFYTSIFEDAAIESILHQENGGVRHGTFSINGQVFMTVDNSKEKIVDCTPAMSLFVTCKRESEVDYVFQRLSEDGTIVIDLAETPFAVKFAWIIDRFGVSWQLQLEKNG
ncbi:hypothetical protein BI350_01660 [Sporosarcina ureilytica]|uniref:PhnB-like domain-containing protein n=2 Tax=Sporosarcina ureilytica TaxID=298596 RepID=A0A1D8JK25_9BACL|nr:VOC family protein [Sporosarcina ureilytica]AOV09033.1 hypothetical protein BI350_01660 [Sporosarcina ureilytica]